MRPLPTFEILHPSLHAESCVLSVAEYKLHTSVGSLIREGLTDYKTPHKKNCHSEHNCSVDSKLYM